MSTAPPAHGRWLIAITFVLALILSMIPMPSWAVAFRPEWVALVLMYWALALPARVGMGVAFVMGLLLDVMHQNQLGQHALGLTFCAFVVVRLHQQIRNFPLWQQSLVVFALLSAYELLMIWIDGINNMPLNAYGRWAPTLSSMVLWPWMFIVLRDLRRRYKVN